MPNTTHTLRTPVAAALAALALASFGLAACGESSGGDSTQTSAVAKQALEQIAKAKSVPSPTTTTPSQSSTASTPSATTRAPQSGKSSTAPSGTTAPRQAAGASRFKQALQKFSVCLRQNGVPVSKNPVKGLLALQGLDRSSPKYKSAALKCRAVLSAAFRGGH